MKWVILHHETGEFLKSIDETGEKKVWTLDIDEAILYSQTEIEYMTAQLELEPEDIRGVGLYLLDRDGTPSFLKQPFVICIDDPAKRQKLIEALTPADQGFSIQPLSLSTTGRVSADESEKE
jgi:hypothetical protein